MPEHAALLNLIIGFGLFGMQPVQVSCLMMHRLLEDCLILIWDGGGGLELASEYEEHVSE